MVIGKREMGCDGMGIVTTRGQERPRLCVENIVFPNPNFHTTRTGEAVRLCGRNIVIYPSSSPSWLRRSGCGSLRMTFSVNNAMVGKLEAML